MTIMKRGGKFLLLSGIGKVLGRHLSEQDAKAQETAIRLSQLRQKGVRVPQKPTGKKP